MKGRSASKIKLTSYDELLGGGEETNDIQQVSLEHLHSFENHPFQVNDDEAMAELVESVKEEGILTALLVRPLGDGEYEIIAGHRRRHAAQLAGLKEVPVIIRNMDQDTAVRAMVDSNLQRPNILPSEKAFAYRMKMEAMNHQGTSGGISAKDIGRLPVHVRVIADEFANIGQIPQFDKLIATIRSREISASIILQSQSQLKGTVDDRTVTGIEEQLNKEGETADSVTKTATEGTKEFYTISTKSGKIFYLIIDNSKSQDNVYFLTEVSEKDLMNFTLSDSVTLPEVDIVYAEPEKQAEEEKPETTETDEKDKVEDEIQMPEDKSLAGTYLLIG